MKKLNYPKDFKPARNVLCNDESITELVKQAQEQCGEAETGTGNIMVLKLGGRITIYQAIAEARLY